MRALIVGCGRMSINHARAVSKLGIDIAAVVDSFSNSYNHFLQHLTLYPAPLFHSSVTAAFMAHGYFDLAIVCTTTDVRYQICLDLLRFNVPYILLEKPVAASLNQISSLFSSLQSSSSRIAVNHQMRFLPQYSLPKELLASPAFGGFHSMYVAAGNFGMAMNGTHYFEAFRFMADQEPVEVSAWFDPSFLISPRGPSFQDVSGCIRVTTRSGRRLYIDASADQGQGVQVIFMSRNGRITVDELTGAMTTVVRSAAYREAPTNRYGMPVEIEQHQIPPVELVDSTKAVLQALLAGEGYPNLADATLAVKTLVAAYHSHRHGGVPVRLADIPDDDPEVFPWA